MDTTYIATCNLWTENNRQTTVGEKFTMIKTREKEMISQNVLPKSLCNLDKVFLWKFYSIHSCKVLGVTVAMK